MALATKRRSAPSGRQVRRRRPAWPVGSRSLGDRRDRGFGKGHGRIVRRMRDKETYATLPASGFLPLSWRGAVDLESPGSGRLGDRLCRPEPCGSTNPQEASPVDIPTRSIAAVILVLGSPFVVLGDDQAPEKPAGPPPGSKSRDLGFLKVGRSYLIKFPEEHHPVLKRESDVLEATATETDDATGQVRSVKKTPVTWRMTYRI